MLFLARRWTGDPRPDGVETTEMLWADPTAPPSPMQEPSAHALDLLRAHQRTGAFQVREPFLMPVCQAIGTAGASARAPSG